MNKTQINKIKSKNDHLKYLKDYYNNLYPASYVNGMVTFKQGQNKLKTIKAIQIGLNISSDKDVQLDDLLGESQ